MRGARQNKGERPWPERIDQHARRARHRAVNPDRKSTRLNSSHQIISYAVFCLKKKNRHACDARQHIIACAGCPVFFDCIRASGGALWNSYLRVALFFFFNDTATTEIYTLSLHDALPI